MGLSDISSLLLERTVRLWRRRLIAGAVMLVFGLVAFANALSAARVALDEAMGPVAGRLILSGVALLIVAVAALVLLWRERREAAVRAKQPFGGDERVVAIAEAIQLGYSLAQDFRRRRSGDSGAAQNGTEQPDQPAPPGGGPADPAARPSG